MNIYLKFGNGEIVLGSKDYKRNYVSWNYLPEVSLRLNDFTRWKW